MNSGERLVQTVHYWLHEEQVAMNEARWDRLVEVVEHQVHALTALVGYLKGHPEAEAYFYDELLLIRNTVEANAQVAREQENEAKRQLKLHQKQFSKQDRFIKSYF